MTNNKLQNRWLWASAKVPFKEFRAVNNLSIIVDKVWISIRDIYHIEYPLFI